MVVEIYPRLLTGAVKKSNPGERANYLQANFPELDEAHRASAASSEDALDAAVSALVMFRHLDELKALEGCRDRMEELEGRIWWPTRDRDAAPPRPFRGRRGLRILPRRREERRRR